MNEIWLVEFRFSDGELWITNPARGPFLSQLAAMAEATCAHELSPGTQYRAMRYVRAEDSI